MISGAERAEEPADSGTLRGRERRRQPYRRVAACSHTVSSSPEDEEESENGLFEYTVSTHSKSRCVCVYL